MQRPDTGKATSGKGHRPPVSADPRTAQPVGSSLTTLAWVTWALAIVGLGLSAYLTYEHYTGNHTLSCPATSTVNCLKVTTSAWSAIAGVPVAVFGLIFFVLMCVGCWPALWRVRRLDMARVVAALVGIGSVIYLVWIELFRVNAICLWCTGVHAVTLLLLAAVLWMTASVRSQELASTRTAGASARTGRR